MKKTLLGRQLDRKDGRLLRLVSLAVCALCVCMLSTVSVSAKEKTVELSMASLFPPESPSAQALNRWAEKVKADSNGQVTVRHYPANTLIAAPDMRTGVRAGVADIGCSFIYKPEYGFEPSLFMSMLIRGLNYEQCLKIFDDLWNKFPEMWASQWKDFKLLWIAPIDPNLLVTAKKEVRELADLHGMQLRVPIPIAAEAVKKLGAVPVSMSPGDWIVSLDKGTTDGAAMSHGSLLDYKIGEKIKSVTYFSLGGPGIIFLVMNRDTWEDLSPEMQKVVENASASGRQDMVDTKRTSVKEAEEYLTGSGVEFIKLSEDEFAKWDAAVKPVYDKIAEDLNKKGYPGTEVVEYALERAKYYSAQH